MNQNIILECKSIEKKFSDTHALQPTDITLEKGNIYGLIGRNGAGKTTLLKLLHGQLIPTSGDLKINENYEVSLSRDFQFYFNKQKCKMILELVALRYKNWNKELEKKLLEEFDFSIKKTYDKISRGNQNILSIIITLCSNTDLLLFDEPYTGLDPVNRELVYQEIIRQNVEENKTIVISSHLITELESVINHAIMIEKGQKIIDDDIHSIKKKSFRIIGNEDNLSSLFHNKNVISTKKLNRQVTLDIYDDLSDEEIKNLKGIGFEVNTLDLQQLLVSITTKRRDF